MTGETESLVQAIRSPSAILVPVINVKNDGGYNDVGCEAGLNMHWKVDPHTVVEVTVTVPHDFGDIVDMFEVQNGHILNISSASVCTVWLSEGLETQAVTLSGVHMNSALSTRLFVLANSESVRVDVQNNLKKQN